MKKIIAITLLLSTSVAALAQTQGSSTNKVNGVSSKGDQNATGSADGLKRKGNGQESPKMKSGVSRSGNSNLSPTGPTNTHGSTSEGSGSVQSTGGATGTGTRQQTRGGVKGAQNARNNTANDGGTTGPGATSGGDRATANSRASTSGSTGGSTRPTSAAAVQKESRTNDRNVGKSAADPTGPAKPGTPGNTSKGSTDKKSGKN